MKYLVVVLACMCASAAQAEAPNCEPGQIHLKSGSCISKSLALQRGYIRAAHKAKKEPKAIEVPRGTLEPIPDAPKADVKPTAEPVKHVASPYGIIVPLPN